MQSQLCPNRKIILFFPTAVVTVVSSQLLCGMIANTSDFVNGHVSTMWFVVYCSPHSRMANWQGLVFVGMRYIAVPSGPKEVTLSVLLFKTTYCVKVSQK